METTNIETNQIQTERGIGQQLAEEFNEMLYRNLGQHLAKKHLEDKIIEKFADESDEFIDWVDRNMNPGIKNQIIEYKAKKEQERLEEYEELQNYLKEQEEQDEKSTRSKRHKKESLPDLEEEEKKEIKRRLADKRQKKQEELAEKNRQLKKEIAEDRIKYIFFDQVTTISSCEWFSQDTRHNVQKLDRFLEETLVDSHRNLRFRFQDATKDKSFSLLTFSSNLLDRYGDDPRGGRYARPDWKITEFVKSVLCDFQSYVLDAFKIFVETKIETLEDMDIIRQFIENPLDFTHIIQKEYYVNQDNEFRRNGLVDATEAFKFPYTLNNTLDNQTIKNVSELFSWMCYYWFVTDFVPGILSEGNKQLKEIISSCDTRDYFSPLKKFWACCQAKMKGEKVDYSMMLITLFAKFQQVNINKRKTKQQLLDVLKQAKLLRTEFSSNMKDSRVERAKFTNL